MEETFIDRRTREYKLSQQITGEPFPVDAKNIKEILNDIRANLEPITLTLKVNGETKIYHSDNVLILLRQLKDEFIPQEIKTMAQFTFEMEGKTFMRFLRVPFMKLLLGNDMRKKMMAKIINLTFGLEGEYLYQ